MFYISFLLLSGYTLFSALVYGPRGGLWRGWLLTLMMAPTWIVKGVGSLQVDLRTGAALAALLGFFLFPKKDDTKFRFLLSDYLLLLVICVQIVSQYVNGDLRPLTPFEIMRKWALPYMMGRLFLGSVSDLRKVMPIICTICLLLSLYAMSEAFLRINPINKLLGKTFALLEQGEGYRMGLKRAQGPLDHPIFFGNMLVLLFPWGIEGARQSLKPNGKRWWVLVPFLMGGALFCTVSRGPQLAVIFTLAVTSFFLFPRLRAPLLALALAAGGFAYAFQDQITELLQVVAGEKQEDSRIIIIDGQPEEYTGTRHRLLLWKVYAPYLRTAGLFGFGYKRTDVKLDSDIADRFASIDNHWMLFFLQHGWLAIIAFFLLTLCTLYYLGTAAWDVRNLEAGFCGALFGALLGTNILLLSVWFSPDFGAVWLFSAGLAANIRMLPRETPEGQAVRRNRTMPVAEPWRPERSLTPGSAPLRDRAN